MKYIPGTKLINKTDKFTNFFKKNKIYKLYNIQVFETHVLYTFKVDGKKVDLKFKSFEHADSIIDNFQ